MLLEHVSRLSPRTQIAVAAVVASVCAYSIADWKYRRATRPFKTKLPKSIVEEQVATPFGQVEVLRSSPSNPTVSVLFVHGGFHSARCFRLFLDFLGANGVAAYAVSMPSHGNSQRLSLFKSITATPRSTYCKVLDSVLTHISKAHPKLPPPILCGHSAGGGLVQIYLDSPEDFAKVHALVLLAAFPATGGASIFMNWFRMDPLMFTRLWSVRPPLATKALAHRAFLSEKFLIDSASGNQFYEELELVESFGWPLSLIRGTFANAENVKKRVGGRVAVIGGAEDRLMTPQVVAHTASLYGVKEILAQKCAHDVMLDVGWEDAARTLLKVLKGFN